MTDQRPTTARKIYFFRIEHFDQFKDRLPGAFQRIENLPFDDRGRYMLEPNKTRLCVFPDSLEYPIKLRFGRTRRDQLPDVENSGKLEALEIAEDAGLIDLGHLIIFEDGHVAAEWNSQGPKLQRLTPYLSDKGGLMDKVNFRNLFERDIVEVVSQLDGVRILDIDMPIDALELAREADQSLADAISATEKLGATKKAGLTLSADQSSSRLKDLALKLARIIQVRPQERNRFGTLRATGYDAINCMTRYVDILEDKLVAGEMFPKKDARSRSIDSNEAYRLIHRVYVDFKPRLAMAAISSDI
jgi:hypothetical protein